MRSACAALALLLAAAPALARDGAALMEAVHAQARQHRNQVMDIELVIEDARGRKRSRFFTMLYKIFSDQTKSLVRFYRPSNIKGTGLLSASHDAPGRPTRQWIYLPAFRTVNQLSSEEQQQSFMGSDFSNADIAGRRPGEDRHRIVSEEGRITLVSSVPVNSEDAYSRIESYILNDIEVPRRVVFYDRAGRKLKTLESLRFRKIEGMVVVMEAEMKNHQSGGRTLLTKRDVDVSRTIDGDEVGLLSLQNR